jgi:hypothetical protein
MMNSHKAFLVVIFITALAATLCFVLIRICVTVQSSLLIKIFFIILGFLVIISWVVMIIQQLYKLIDFKHWQRIQRQNRELALEEAKRTQQYPPTFRRRSTLRERYR